MIITLIKIISNNFDQRVIVSSKQKLKYKAKVIFHQPLFISNSNLFGKRSHKKFYRSKKKLDKQMNDILSKSTLCLFYQFFANNDIKQQLFFIFKVIEKFNSI